MPVNQLVVCSGIFEKGQQKWYVYSKSPRCEIIFTDQIAVKEDNLGIIMR